MKLKCLFAISTLLLAPGIATAVETDNGLRDLLCNSQSYVGADLQSRITHFKNNHGKKFFKNSATQGHVYVGTKLHPCFAFEAGYEQTVSKRRTVNVGEGEVVLGDVNLTNGLDNCVFQAKHYISGFHLDAVGFCPINSCFELFANIGVGFLKMKAKDFTWDCVDIDQARIPISESFQFNSGHQALLRAGIGAQYKVLPCLSLRGQAIWENTRELTAKASNIDPPPANLVVKTGNSYTLGLGLVYAFQ